MLNKMLKSILGGLLLSGIILSFNLTPLLAQDTSAGEPLTHTVQAGENLYRIALRYGVDLNELVTVNQITDRTRIFRGQVLLIPGLTVPDESDEVFNPLIAGTPATHVVQPGENLSGIARQYGMTLDQLLAANFLLLPKPQQGQKTSFSAQQPSFTVHGTAAWRCVKPTRSSSFWAAWRRR